MALLELVDIVKEFAGCCVVNHLNLSIHQGEFFTLLGPSGCGKTTLLRMIAGFEQPDSGKILLSGECINELPPEKRPLHTVFQSYALFPHMTVAENIAFPLKMSKWGNRQAIKAQVDELIADVRLESFAQRYPAELSGGQKQRVALARALVDRPKILLLDEPLSALDARLREQMHVELVKLQEETGVTFIYVTHDQNEALALSSRIAVLKAGIIEQLGTPRDIYAAPKTHYVADFIGKCNLLPAIVLSVASQSITLRVADSFIVAVTCSDANINITVTVGMHGWFALRPEKIKANREIRINPESVSIKVQVKGYYYYGESTLYEFILPNSTQLHCMLANNRSLQADFFEIDEEVFVSIDYSAGTFLLQ